MKSIHKRLIAVIIVYLLGALSFWLGDYDFVRGSVLGAHFAIASFFALIVFTFPGF
jgi:hypothetical protein